MGQELKRLKRKKSALERMENLFDSNATSLIIHYSCESFDKADGKTPRITSIAVRRLLSGQTDSFSIHQIAEKNKISFQDINTHYDALEKEMLDHFFDCVKSQQNANWIHWNMRDVNYGFAAIEHRYRVLGGEPFQILEEKKFDLARAMVDIYGIHYIGHPRLESIIKKNNITDRDFLPGVKEAEAFDNREFVKLHQSTLRKVDTIANLFERALNKDLKTNSSWFQQNGYTLRVVGELLKGHWIVSMCSILAIVLTIIVRVFNLMEYIH